MGRKLAPGDEKNASFELPESALQDHKSGFDPGEREGAAGTLEGSHRFSRRTKEKSIPKESIADRVRKTRARGA